MSLFSRFQTKLPIDTQQIEQAIAHLERQTSAELRVVVERKTSKKMTAIERANQLFDELQMANTAERNAVLIYLSFKPHQLAVIGDQAIHQKVGEHFWQSVYASMKTHCEQGAFTAAICCGIQQVEDQLATYFPLSPHDIDELENEVVIR